MDYVLLCGGKGDRFKKDTPFPKPLIPIGGNAIYEWCLRSVLSSSTFHVRRPCGLTVVTNADPRSRDIHRRIRDTPLYNRTFQHPLRRVELPKQTRDPTESASIAIQALAQAETEEEINDLDVSSKRRKETKPTWIIDNDVVFSSNSRWDVLADDKVDDEVDVAIFVVRSPYRDISSQNATDGSHSSFCHAILKVDHTEGVPSVVNSTNVGKAPNHQTSFLENQTGALRMVIEKPSLSHLRSSLEQIRGMDSVVMGAYGFKNKRIFLELEKRARTKSQGVVGELSLSYLVAEAVDSGMKVSAVFADDSFTIGTPEQIEFATRRGLLQARSPSLFQELDSNAHHPSIRRRWVVDLDETITSLPEIPKNYNTCELYEDVVELVREEKRKGTEIVIFTARHMDTCKGNAIEADKSMRVLTERFLKDHDVPYDSLIFGKPRAHVYLDDRAVNTFFLKDEYWRKAATGYGNHVPRKEERKETSSPHQSRDHHGSQTCVKYARGKEVCSSQGKSDSPTQIVPVKNVPTYRQNVGSQSDELRSDEREPDAQLSGYAYYLRNIPEKIKHVAPEFRGIDPAGGILMEWIDGTLLSDMHIMKRVDLYTNCRPGPDFVFFEDVLSLMDAFHEVHERDVEEGGVTTEEVMMNYIPKLEKRMKDPENSDVYRILEKMIPLQEIVCELKRYFGCYSPLIKPCIHGDFWMGNIIVVTNPRPAHDDNVGYTLRAIDMRGAIGCTNPRNTSGVEVEKSAEKCAEYRGGMGELFPMQGRTIGGRGVRYSIGGDMLYDYAKLYQSLKGFDFLIQENTLYMERTAHDISIEKLRRRRMIQTLDEHLRRNTGSKFTIIDVHYLSMCLLLACVPFHRKNVETAPESWAMLFYEIYEDIMGCRHQYI